MKHKSARAVPFEKGNEKVLQIITLFSIGGATETVISTSIGLRNKGYDVTIVAGSHIASEGDMLPIACDAGLKVIILPALQRSIRPMKEFLAFLQIRSIIKAGKFTVVHTHSSKAGIIGRLAGCLAGAPCIVHTVHGLSFHQFQSWYLRTCYVLLEKLASRCTDAYIAVSERMKSEYLRKNISTEEKYRIIPSCFSIADFSCDIDNSLSARSELHIPPNAFVIGKVSRLSPLKGHDLLIEVMPELIKNNPNILFLFIGDGELGPTLKEKVRMNGLEQYVKFVGVLPPLDIPKYIRTLNLLIHASFHEGGPRVIPQALIMGVPVVSFDVGIAAEVIRNRINGMVVKSVTARGLLDGVNYIMEHYEEVKQNCLSGIADLKQQFSEEVMNEKTAALYRELIDGYYRRNKWT